MMKGTIHKLLRYIILFALGVLLTLRAIPTGAEVLPSPAAPISADTWAQRGEQLYGQGKWEAAIAAWEKSAQLYQTDANATGVTGSLINQAKALERLGHYRRACQSILTAIDLKEQRCEFQDPEALSSVLEAFEAETNEPLRMLGFTSLGNALRLLGHLPEAQRLLEEAVAIAQDSGQLKPQIITLLSLGRVEQSRYQQALYLYRQTGRLTERDQTIEFAAQAIAHYRQAEELATAWASSPSGSPQLMVQTGVQLLDMLSQLYVNPEMAEQDWVVLPTSLSQQIQRRVQAILQWPLANLPASRELIDSQVSLAQSLIRLGGSQRSVEGQEAAIQIAAQDIIAILKRCKKQAIALEDKAAQSQVLGTLGHFYEVWDEPDSGTSSKAKHQKQAQQNTHKALTLAQAIQSPHLAYQWQWQLGRLYQANARQAIPYYQAATESLGIVRQDLLAIDTDVRFALRDDVEPLYREFVSLLLANLDSTRSEGQPAQENLQRAVQEIDALQLAQLEDFLSCNLTQQVALDKEQVDPRSAIVYPILLPDQIAVVVRLPQSDQLQLYRTTVADKEVVQALQKLRRQVERPFLTKGFIKQSQQVYNWLIQPIEEVLAQQDIDTLVFVSDGVLRNLPMSVLHDGEKFLIEKYALALSPSLRLPASRPLTEAELKALAFGLSEMRPDFLPHEGFAPLSYVKTELDGIQELVPSQNLLNQDFTSDRLQALVGDTTSPVVHLATHGQFSSNPSETFLLAWDQRISLDELSLSLSRRNEQSAIELLVLSACQTASGDPRATLGLAGVAIQSGARSTIASLWNVDDVATAELMQNLYQALSEARSESGEPLSRAQALRQAQLSLLNTPGFRAPLFWSAFVLIGNWQ